MIVHEYNDKPSNFRYTKTLNEVMEENFPSDGRCAFSGHGDFRRRYAL